MIRVPQALVVAGMLAAGGPIPLRAQHGHPSDIRWYHALGGLGVLAAVSPLDLPLRNTIQANRSHGKDRLASLVRHVGQPEIYASAALGTLGAGLVFGDDGVTRAGGRMIAALTVAGVSNQVIKVLVGRRRPLYTDTQYDLHPLSGDASWPSGHTTMAFALATSAGDEIGSTPVSIGLYSLAALTGWSRMNDNKHWLTDVLAGAAFGVLSAKLMNGRARVFGIREPGFLEKSQAMPIAAIRLPL